MKAHSTWGCGVWWPNVRCLGKSRLEEFWFGLICFMQNSLKIAPLCQDQNWRGKNVKTMNILCFPHPAVGFVLRTLLWRMGQPISHSVRVNEWTSWIGKIFVLSIVWYKSTMITENRKSKSKSYSSLSNFVFLFNIHHNRLQTGARIFIQQYSFTYHFGEAKKGFVK
jgi:hypothetical protein